MNRRSLLCALVILQAGCCAHLRSWQVTAGNSSRVAGRAASQIGGVSVYLQDPIQMSRARRDEFVDGGTGDACDQDLADHGEAADHGAVPQPEGEAADHGAAPQGEAADAEADVDFDDGGSRSGEVECLVCRKLFKNDKSMFGHLRSHPNRGYKGATPPLKMSSTPASSSSPPLLPVGGSSCSISDVCLSTYEQLAACVLATLKHWHEPGRLQSQAPPPPSPLCSNKRKHESMEQAVAVAVAGAREQATSIMEGSSSVLHDEREAQRKGTRKLKEIREARRKGDGPSRKEKRRPYMCKHCNEEFSTHQALGGHMAGHHKEKRILKEKLLGRSLVLEEQPERSLSLKEKQPERGLILEEKQPERSQVLKDKKPERSLTLKEKQPEVYQDKIDQTMNSQDKVSDKGAAYLDGGSNAAPIAEAEEDRRLPYGFDLNLEASKQGIE